MKSTIRAGVIAGLAAFAASAPSALAAPVTVDVRVEGPTRTLVEQKVTVDTRLFKYSDDPQSYRCDSTGDGGTTTTPAPTRNGALAEVAERGGLELTGSYFTGLGVTYERINGESVAFDGATNRYLVEYKNGAAAAFGGCNEPMAEGEEVLFAYGDGSEQLLRLAGPATVRPGESATLTVTDRANGNAVAGATVAGQSTGGDGRVTTAALTQRGVQSFKASRTGSIRSNAVAVCVTDGADGFCGTTAPGAAPAPTTTPAPVALPDTVAAFASIGSIAEGRRYARGRGPRTLRGTVDAEAAGIDDVRLRLSRTDGPRCTRYDGARERLVSTRRCGIRNAPTFSVGDDAAFSYLLPSALPRGRYVLDVIVIDGARNRTTTYQRGRNRVVFFVG